MKGEGGPGPGVADASPIAPDFILHPLSFPTSWRIRPIGRDSTSLTDQDLAVLCARTADEHRARDVVVMDMRRATPFCDFFVLASGASKRQMQTIANRIEEEMKAHGERKLGLEGYSEGRWILLDFGFLVVHVFAPEARSYYDLELLWGDTPRIAWKD